MKKRGLGRGLEMLLSQTGAEIATDNVKVEQEGIKELPIERLVPGKYQPRRHFDQEALEALASSIKAQGIIQPIVVREVEGQKQVEILAGERRWRASQLAGLKSVPVIFKPMSDQEALAVALIENIQRENLNPVETAMALKRLIDEFSLTHQEAGEVIGKSRSSITNSLRLLELDAAVQALLAEQKLDMGHARALLALPKSEQGRVALQVIKEQLTVRATEQLVKKLLAPESDEESSVKRVEKDRDVLNLERSLSEFLGAQTEIKQKNRGRGEVVIRYNSLEELDGILGKIKQ
ncbi:chromosome partitioning protein ParB [Ignatzschineria cameli]|uniref:Probable chromosome-partitioning protein ParB n=2 Tax=Ignatzschineria cameli TaxID=2182793 RepID=A0A2U2AQZ9_9GAMM|nr:ParB/RepB/Spo0J family partition protein [Ignatzschineria cameli]PWD85255.1 chromosome partitioning protein ParB [Ignatzschineria cameli]PWD86320.1 chromosome partitioning protein ParB [Ignatzschineria cameli]PWD89842.1 chromosome partitioning protein ParB [Ignatzschineria cameli]PWD91492.1 chromosome partitioning protein ParB [Ignatzschineria cameli]PWD92530.1 chromosome partitioning protein ParB [Ignatzschineria cameli]